MTAFFAAEPEEASALREALGAGEALVGEGVATRVTMGSSDLWGKMSWFSLGNGSGDLNDLTGHVLDLA